MGLVHDGLRRFAVDARQAHRQRHVEAESLAVVARTDADGGGDGAVLGVTFL
jgi:hypothetical protein